ncbi:ATP-binding protein [Sphingobium nicotianae]|uniref:ATP-binding protein n=1 Tax=Sphingobium nicotianae TaxID=2782607 RepID=A0A9X1ITG6_9SPHN|nr:ATP-binding protein [Sphingobium nicotianae]MBT2189297.1 ATP-binding protein [Sphingobium nicotianae]
MSPEYDIASPGAAELFESLRAFGYDLPTALADIIDNSISASARNIWIDMTWDGAASRITIRDDGRGMTEDALRQAMRPGSLSPLEDRAANDLGRFGLGMKTASISQCRCLTVMSKPRDGEACIRRWDLDYIASTGTGEWRLLKGSDLLTDTDRRLLEEQDQGTILFWDRLDQLVGDAAVDDETAQKHFRERADAVKAHLAMVFHRFLRGRNAIRLHLNGRPIEAWDPFLEDTDKVDPLPAETLVADGEAVEVKAFILPHHTRITPEQHAGAAGPRGWNAHQGFYIYRNKRLLVAGDWLGLGMQKEEHFKLARIRIDLANSADLAWQIDVKKSRARPPAALRRDLLRIARAARGQASSIYRHRGKVVQRKLGSNDVFLWNHVVKRGKTYYKINRDHPLVRKVLETADDKAPVRALLALVEQTIPAPLIVINNAETPDGFGQPFEDSSADLRTAMAETFQALIEGGRGRPDAARALLTMEPFNQYPEMVAVFLEEAATGQ